MTVSYTFTNMNRRRNFAAPRFYNGPLLDKTEENHPFLYEQIDKVFSANGAIVIQTDTVAGLLSLNKQAIYEIKNRPLEKRLVVFSDNEHLKIEDPIFNHLTQKFWPGKLTIIINNCAYRLPKHPIIINLVNRYRYIFSSSANLTEQPPITSYEEGLKAFSESKYPILFINSTYKTISEPSTIYNIDTRRIIRQGLITQEDIVNAFKQDKNIRR